MANYADVVTDRQLLEMEKRIAEIYKQASDDLQKRSNEYFNSFAKRYEQEYDAYLRGEYTDREFKQWYMTQVGRGERWNVLKTDMANKMTQANQIAAAYINDKTPGIYSLNANFTAYELEKSSGIAFNIVEESVVRELIKGANFSEFRVNSINPVRDYNWNKERIQTALLSGILQGDSIPRLASRYMDVMGANMNAAIRNARTSVTSAQNGGRQKTFDAAIDMGIELQKEWMATNDSRTRDSHRELDGVVVDNKDVFPNGCMFPGDPAGAPEEVYNCRCTMVAFLPKYSTRRLTALNGGKNTGESYEKWLDSKRNHNDVFVFEPAKDIKEVKERMAVALGLSENDISLGRMNLGLANEYLDGVETFVNDFPQIKGLYTGMDTKTGGNKYSYTFGVNKLEGRMIRHEGSEVIYKCTNVLAFKSPQDLNDMRQHYEQGLITKQCYENVGPKATAIHELVHGLDRAINMRERGYFVDGVLQTEIRRSEWHNWSSSISSQLVKDTKIEMFGKINGKEVYDGISYLGSYSLVSSQEMLAEAISYEYINKSNPYSAKMLEKLKERVKEAFK